MTDVDRSEKGPPLAPSLLLGIGLGGFVDGIVFHQIFQWHHILSDEGCCAVGTVSGLEDNTLADGIFHGVTWLFVLAGTILAVRAWQQGRLAPPWRAHLGGLLVGWGGFNLLEGLVNHQILGIHHVRDDLGGPLGWDLAFLGFGALLVLAGVAMIRSGRERKSTDSSPRRPSALVGSAPGVPTQTTEPTETKEE